MHGFKRIFVFCLVTTLLPALLIILPLWLRHVVYADVTYKVAESDILEIRHGISSIFCSRHSLRMNTSFNAFQLNRKPKVSEIRKHIRLRKSMILPDDTLEYWGFYLLKGATVTLKVCSRYDGSRILVVKGDKHLKTCGLLEHNKNKYGANAAAELGNVIVTFETNAEVILNDTSINATQPRLNAAAEEEEDGLGLHFDVPKIKYKEGEHPEEEDENDASERDDEIDFELMKTTTTRRTTTANKKETKRRKPEDTQFQGVEFTTLRTRSGERVSLSDAPNLSSDSMSSTTSRSQEKPEVQDVDQVTQEISTESKTEYIKSHGSSKEGDLMETQPETTDSLVSLKSLLSSEGILGADDDDDEETPLTSKEKEVLQKYLKRISQRKTRRSKRDLLIETRARHGITNDTSTSVSSFENNLLSCYDGQILLAQSFPPSTLCRNVIYLESGSHMVTQHEINADGYYYYIFYSDNDNVKNDINALFDIHKPTFLYANISDTSKCYNATNCSFPIDFLTDEVVIVEVPTRDGIEHEGDDFTVLISTCHPRMGVYVIFPIAVLFLILTCAFL